LSGQQGSPAPPAAAQVEVLDFARHYKISTLADAAARMIKDQMSVANVCLFFATAVKFNHEQLSADCHTFCAANMEAVTAQVPSPLPPPPPSQTHSRLGFNRRPLACTC
jgi:hypothetical protein